MFVEFQKPGFEPKSSADRGRSTINTIFIMPFQTTHPCGLTPRCRFYSDSLNIAFLQILYNLFYANHQGQPILLMGRDSTLTIGKQRK